MGANQDKIIVEQEKSDFNAVVDAKKFLSLYRSANKPEPLVHPTADDNDYPQKTRGPSTSDHLNNRCQPTDDSVNHDSIIADYKNANLNRRLQMYLQFPLLTTKFDLINRNDRRLETSSDFKLQIKSFATQMGIALGSAMGCGGPVP